MTEPSPDYAALARAAARQGLLLRGGFHPKPEDQVPPLADGRTTGTLLMLGNAGPSLWAAFSGAPEFRSPGDPLNAWSQRVVSALAKQWGATALLPFDGPPWWPFQRWARRAEEVWTSPVGMLIHARFGLWHAYRGALALAGHLDLPKKPLSANSPCVDCADQPCLNTCPAEAFSAQGYDVPACLRHIATAAGQDCMSLACRARRSCPIGHDYQYQPAQAAFHMEAFRRAPPGQ